MIERTIASNMNNVEMQQRRLAEVAVVEACKSTNRESLRARHRHFCDICLCSRTDFLSACDKDTLWMAFVEFPSIMMEIVRWMVSFIDRLSSNLPYAQRI